MQQIIPDGGTAAPPWHVAHTRPRCEKKLASYCAREGFEVELPCVKSRRQYGRKTVTFEKPVFPGYIFFRSRPEHTQKVYQNRYVANVLKVFDQVTFEQQLREIVRAIENDCLVMRIAKLTVGTMVKMKAGPLAGMSGSVLSISNQTTVVLNLDFIGQGAAVMVDDSAIEIIE